MSAINEARELFERSGLVLPPIPSALQARLRRISEWCYGTRDIDPMQMYGFHLYPAEAVAEPIDNYVALSHAGHGVNSYAINYHPPTVASCSATLNAEFHRCRSSCDCTNGGNGVPRPSSAGPMWLGATP